MELQKATDILVEKVEAAIENSGENNGDCVLWKQDFNAMVEALKDYRAAVRKDRRNHADATEHL